MDQQVMREFENVFEAYGWNPIRIRGDGNFFQVFTDEEIYALKRVTESREKLVQITDILSRLKQAEFSHFVPFERAKNGDYIVSTEQGNWYATKWLEQDPENLPSMEEIIQSLARLHKSSELIVTQFADLRTSSYEDYLEHWQEEQANFQHYKEELEQKEFPSPFEQVLLSHHETIDQLFHFAIRGIEKLLETEQGSPPREVLCHLRVHPTNYLKAQNRFIWLDFDHAGVDSPVRDLATLIRRYNPEQGQNEIAELLSQYEKENPLSAKEKRLLALHLAYPERLVRLTKQYQHQGYTQNESDSLKALEAELEHLETLQSVVTELWKTSSSVSANPKEERKASSRTTKTKSSAKKVTSASGTQMKKKTRKKKTN